MYHGIFLSDKWYEEKTKRLKIRSLIPKGGEETEAGTTRSPRSSINKSSGDRPAF